VVQYLLLPGKAFMVVRNPLICLGILLILFAGCKSPAKSTGTNTKTSSSAIKLSSLESEILAEVNRHRKSIGLNALQANSVIGTEAALHSQHMASRQVSFGHDGFEGRISRINKRLGGITSSAENVAYGKMTAHEVVQGWLKSPPHKKNMEGKYNLTGIGVSRNSQGIIYYTQIFSQKS
jgi:uncharacterized protein YkwD